MSFSGSEDDEPVIDITQWAPRQNNTRPDKPAPPQARAPSPIQRTQSPDVQVISSSESEPESESASESEGSIIHVASFRERDVQVVIDRPSDFDPEDYEDWTIGGDVVHRVVKVLGHGKRIVYVVEFMDLHKERVSPDDLLGYENGQEALSTFTSNEGQASSGDEYEEVEEASARPSRFGRSRPDYVDITEALEYLEDEDDDFSRSKRQSKRKRSIKEDTDDSDSQTRRRRSTRVKPQAEDRPTTRRSGRTTMQNDDSSADELASGFFLQSDVAPRKRQRQRSGKINYVEPQFIDDDEDDIHFDRASKKTQRQGVRQSGRSTRYEGDMQDPGVNDIYRSDSEPRPVAPPKPVGQKENFITLPRSDPFRARHMQQCDSCRNDANFAPLIYCQGCTFAYHKSCISHRSSREHIATKVGDKNFILQCRRCIAFPRRKEQTAPDQGKCSDCKEHGPACAPFRERKTPAQEQKDREENDGEDPIFQIDPSLINNPDKVLFRCTSCFRGFHFEHLPSKSGGMELNSDDVADQRFIEYSQDWQCYECETVPAKVSGIVAWKPIDEDAYDPRYGFDMVNEEDKAYLLRWEGKSYFQATWMPGPWAWGYTAGAMRKAFAKRDEARLPKMRTEDAIPEDYLRADIVLDVKYTSIVDVPGEEIDKARIREVDVALIKFKGLGYEDAVWEKPPTPDDEERWTDFVTAYNDWVLGKYVKQPKAQPLKTRLEKARASDFTKLEKKKQPDNISGGELMRYQIEGVNWLYYKWFTQKNAILADEMGLGKTIQIIGFLATLVQDWNCFPFLVVVPNSTCANWRREIKKWAPSLRVVAYFGSKEARDLTSRYEMFARDSRELRCHIVVTSYECAADDGARKFFRSIPWQAMVIDEGQRLKSDKTQLYSSLAALKIPFKILLTGTPLQNNARELFNLLQFLDDTFDAAALEQRFQDLNSTKITELHDMIRPFFLRRTKAQVLTFLPPMAQIIVPVSMSTLQKKLYKSILGKNPDLLRAIFGGARELSASQRASLSNILMQLRKCLCHPFVYNQGIEERNVIPSVSHRNLVEASGKLQMLELLLPKLKERGHRVLIFSQFLDMLSMCEDFMDGMELRYQRLDGTISSLQKQKRIDEFNHPESQLFAFLLSTRAGGVGINLATADTVIILDPDFNPHQDIQALSRAHRIGQKKKVLCIQLVTRASAEEKIMQYGRKKMALDHVLIEQMDAEDAPDRDLEGILRYGAAELFEDNGEKDVKYDDAAIDKLLDASQVEHTQAGADQTAESTFSFARVWANNDLGNALPEAPEAEETAPDPSVWDKILKERERVAAAEAADAQQALGRGRRAKAMVDYAPDREMGEPAEGADNDAAVSVLEGSPAPRHRKARNDESDTDFQADSDVESVAEDPNDGNVSPNELKAMTFVSKSKLLAPTFHRVEIPRHSYTRLPTFSEFGTNSSDPPTPLMAQCQACQQIHAQGSCQFKINGVEYCSLCNVAHYGFARNCPHINSETQVRDMLASLKDSPEAGHLKKEALRYLTGLKGTLVQKKKHKIERTQALAAAASGIGQQQNGGNSSHHGGDSPPLAALPSAYPAYTTPSGGAHDIHGQGSSGGSYLHRVSRLFKG